MMTRKHFRIIANAMAQMDVTGEQCDIMIDALKQTNERFNPSRFKREVARLKAEYNEDREISFGSDMSEQEHNDSISTLGDNMPEWYSGPNM